MTTRYFLLLFSCIQIILLRCVDSSDPEVCVDGTFGAVVVGGGPTPGRIGRARDDAPPPPGSSSAAHEGRLVRYAMEARAACRPEEAISAFSRLREEQEERGRRMRDDGGGVDDGGDDMALAEVYHGIVLAEQYRGEEALDCWLRAISIQERVAGHRPGGEIQAFRFRVGALIHRAAEHYSAVANEPRNSSNGRLHLDAAKLCNAVGDTDRAARHLEAVLRIEPENSLAMYVLGTLREGEGRGEEAEGLKRTAAELQPGNTAGAMLAAARACGEGDLDACRRRFMIAYEYAYREGNVRVASRAVSSAMSALLQLRGEAGLAECRAIGEGAVARGVLNAPLQAPASLVLGLHPARAYHDDSGAWEAVRALEGHAAEIRDEVLSAYRSGKLAGRYEYDSIGDLQLRGHWGEVNIVRQGVPQARVVELLPVTSRVVLSIPNAVTMVHGGSKVSVIDGGSLVRPHTGCCNSRLRVHMGISVPDDCGIIVDDEARTWVEGKCMVFDDSFVHSVWQNSTQVRIILIVDIWHPHLDEAGREATMDERQIKRYRQIQHMVTDGTWLEAAGLHSST
jgi:tetratricopeptide (TPR) repeat protein